MHTLPIAVIAPDLELYQMAVQLKEELGFDYAIFHYHLNEAVIATRRIVEEGTLILVSRGGTLDRLRDNFPTIPLVGIPITEYEIAVTLAEAKKSRQ